LRKEGSGNRVARKLAGEAKGTRHDRGVLLLSARKTRRASADGSLPEVSTTSASNTSGEVGPEFRKNWK